MTIEQVLLLVTKDHVEGFFIGKIVQMERVRNIQRVITVETIIHPRAKPWDKLDYLLNICQLHNISHALAIRPHMAVEEKHIDVRCGLEGVDTSLLV